MNVDNVVLEPGTAGMVVALMALQQANGIDFDTAVARVRQVAESGPLLVGNTSWADLVALLRWFAIPPAPPAP